MPHNGTDDPLESSLWKALLTQIVESQFLWGGKKKTSWSVSPAEGKTEEIQTENVRRVFQPFM